MTLVWYSRLTRSIFIRWGSRRGLWTHHRFPEPTRAGITGFGSDLRNILGEFFFLPFEADEVIYFTTVLTITGSVREDVTADLSNAIARLNYYMPCGCFALGDHDSNLIYRFAVPIVGAETKAKQEQAVSMAANTAIMVAEKFEGYLKLVMNNEITVDEMVEMTQRGN